ncbi:MAG: hypothetical protein WCS99_00490 [Limisphaerales bacterium]
MSLSVQELAEWVSIAKDVTTALAAAVGATVAARGLNAWKKQLRGKTDYELSRRLLRAVYKVRDSIPQVRSPMIFEGERDEAIGEAKLTPEALKENFAAQSSYAVYRKRWLKLSDAVRDLDAEIFEAEVSWGKEIKVKCGALKKQLALLQWSIQMHLSQKQQPTPSPLSKEQVTEVNRVLFDLSEESKPDSFTLEVNKAVEAVETLLQPHLK